MSVSPAPPAPITVDSLLIVDFAAGGNSLPYRTDGWGAPEARMAWGVGARSGVRLPAPWDRQPRVLELDLHPCRHDPVPSGQMLRLLVNGWSFGTHLLARRSLIRCVLDPMVWDGLDALDIGLEHPCYFVPKLLGMSGDSRTLAVSCFSVRLYCEREAGAGPALAALPAPVAGVPVIRADLQTDTPPPSTTEAGPGVRCHFGAHGTARPFTRAGWAPPEPNVQWTGATLALLDLPALEWSGPQLLHLDIVPFTVPEKCPAQVVTITLGGMVLGQFSITAPSVLGVPLPRELVAGQPTLRLGFHIPGAARPCDLGTSGDSRLLGLCFRAIGVEALAPGAGAWADRRVDDIVPAAAIAVSDRFVATPNEALAAAVEAELGLTPADLLRTFESLGDNCEVGMVQRKLGLGSFGPFGFGFTPLIGLLKAFDDDFAAMLDADAVAISLGPPARRREYLVGLPRYGIRNHSFVHDDQADAETVRRAQPDRLAALRAGFHESLRGGGKMFVLLRDRPLTLVEVLPVLQALNRYGRNALMFVVSGAAPERSGAVDLLAPGLLRGHIAAFAPAEDVMSVELPDWLRLCANAWRLNRLHPTAER